MRGLITLILVIGAFALVFSVANPLWVEIQSIQAEQAVVEDTLTRLTQLQALRDELLTSFNAIPRASLERLDEMLPKAPEIEKLLIALESISQDHSLDLSRVSFAQAFPEAAGVSTVGYNFSVDTSYFGFKEFLASLENNLRLIDVNNISFSADNIGDTVFSLQANSYFMPR